MRMFSVLQLICLVFVSGGQAKTLGADVEVDDMILDQEQMDWLKSGLLHGELDDLIVNENTPKAPAISANALRDPNKLWPNKIVYYSFDATLTSSEQNTVRTTVSGLQDKLSSCLTFQEKNDGNRIIVGTSGKYFNSYVGGCWSEVGYKAKPQYLNLAGGCWGTGTIEHEFLHAIGIYHQQSRSDRDKHVKIITNNIIDDKKHNFNKYDQTRIFHHGLPYDYGSVMHYGKSYFAKIPGDITIETLDPTKQDVIGNRDGVTSGDIELVRRAYGCSDRSCEVHVGNSTTNTISATVTEGCVCPVVINKSNWLAGDTSHDYTQLTDEFAVTQDGSSLEVQRTDSNYGWGMDLTFMCSRQGSCEVHVGNSTTNTTSATVTEGCVCPVVINKSNWLAGDTSHDYTQLTDEFAVTQDGSSLVVQRTDSNYGWGMDLTFMCSRQDKTA